MSTDTAVTTPAPANGSKSLMMLGVINSLAILAAGGMLFYTKIQFKRPPITEHSERARLAELQAAPATPTKTATIVFEPMTVNIESFPSHPKPADGTSQQIQGKLHYAQVGFALEIRDENKKEIIESIRPILLDKLLSMLGRKPFHELTTVQGRYLLRAQILDLSNKLIAKYEQQGSSRKGASKDALVTNVFFTTFIVQ